MWSHIFRHRGLSDPSPMLLVTLGSGPDVFLVHGCPQPPSALMPLARRLAAHVRAHVVHLPGYGDAPSPSLPYAPSAAEEALAALVRGTAAGPLGFVGLSLGTYRTMSLSLRGELDVRAQVQIGPLAHMTKENHDALKGFAGAFRAGVDVQQAVVDRCFSAAFRAAHPEHCQAVARSVLGAAPADVVASELEVYADAPDLRARLGALPGAITLIGGTEDPVVPVDELRDLGRLLPGARQVILEGAGHYLLEERLEEVAAAALEGLAPLLDVR